MVEYNDQETALWRLNPGSDFVKASIEMKIYYYSMMFLISCTLLSLSITGTSGK